MQERSKFEQIPDVPASRSTDPDTSKQAEREITREGSRAEMLEIAYRAVCSHPGKTSNELERLLGYTDGQLRKRLNDLYQLGRIRKGPARVSAVSGRKNQTWEPIKEGE